MRRNIDLPEILWDTMTTLSEEMGYKSRQALIEEVLTVFTSQYPDAKYRSMDASAKRLAGVNAKKEFNRALKPSGMFREVSSEEVMEMWNEVDGLTDGVKEQLSQAMDEPELPEL